MSYEFSAELWEYGGNNTWHFVTLPFDQTDEIDEITAPTKRGFGSVRVQVTVGNTTWNTSIFPDAKRKSFVLPMKKQVRTAEKLQLGELVKVSLDLA